MRRILGAALSLLLATTMAAAQEPQPGRLRLEAHAGAFNDPYDASPDGEHTGLHLGLRLGYDVAARARLIGSAGYALSRDVSNPNGLTSYHRYDNTWALTTVGVEYDVLPGRTSASLGVQAGLAWRRVEHTGQVGTPPAFSEEYGGRGFGPVDVVVPGLVVRHRVTPRAALLLSLQDQILDVLEGPAQHSPALVAGVSLR